MVYYSALHWAKKAEKSAEKCKEIQEDLDNSGLDLSKYLDYNHITNCITEIPQDIKLELKDGVLTLKAGSKVYVPNGAGKFDEYTISGDINVGVSGNNGSYLLFYRTDNLAYANIAVGNCISGTTAPTTGFVMFYNTESNLVRSVNNGSISGVQWSLPLAKISKQNNVISIDQVFNGFGYIGSTVFALPGVKGLIPNGRNADGTLNNIEFVNDTVRMFSYTYVMTNTPVLFNGGTLVSNGGVYYFDDKLEIINPKDYQRAYVRKENQWYYRTGNSTTWQKGQIFPVGYVTKTTGGVVTSLNTDLPFRAADEQNTPKLDGDNEFSGTNNFNGMTYFNKTVSFVKNTTNTQDTYQDINYIRDNALETNNIPYNKTYYTNALMDKNNKFVTYIQNTHKADGSSTMSISARTQNANGENVTSSIIVSAEKNGNVFATAPRPTASNSMDSKEISTVGWANDPSASLNIVHRTGNESFSGTKTMLDSKFVFGATNLGNYKEIEALSEKGSTRLGVLRFQNGSDGVTRSIDISVVDNTNSNRGGLKVGINSGGVPYVVAPTPPTGDNSTQIATTEWFNNKHKVVSALPSSPTAGVFYYITE